MIPATEWDEIVAELNPGEYEAAEVRPQSIARIMSEPPGPIKAGTTLWYTERCPSGLPDYEEGNR